MFFGVCIRVCVRVGVIYVGAYITLSSAAAALSARAFPRTPCASVCVRVHFLCVPTCVQLLCLPMCLCAFFVCAYMSLRSAPAALSARAFLRVCVCVCLCLHVCVYVCAFACAHACVCVSVYMYMLVRACVCTCIVLFLCVCVCVCVCICFCVCRCACTWGICMPTSAADTPECAREYTLV